MEANAVWPGVDIEAARLREADQRGAEFLGDLYGEARGGADRNEHGDAGGEGLLHQLEAGAAADDEDRSREKSIPAQELGADDLVHGIVTADILADDDGAAFGREQAGGMEPAGVLKSILGLAQAVGKGADDVLMRLPPDRREFRKHVEPEGFHRGLAADAATGGGVAISLEAFEIKRNAGAQLDADAVLQRRLAETRAAGGQALQLIESAQQAFADQKTGGEFLIVAGGAHGDGDRLYLPGVRGAEKDLNLQWFLDGKVVDTGLEAFSSEALDGSSDEESRGRPRTTGFGVHAG